jgi:hypothetical protein
LDNLRSYLRKKQNNSEILLLYRKIDIRTLKEKYEEKSDRQIALAYLNIAKNFSKASPSHLSFDPEAPNGPFLRGRNG